MLSPDAPRFASALATDPDYGIALERAVEQLMDQLGGRTPDLVLAFATHHYGAALDKLGADLQRMTAAGTVSGCTGGSIVGSATEVEGSPALALWAASMPGTVVRAVHYDAQHGSDGWQFSGLPVVEERERAGLMFLADPFSFPMPDYLRVLNDELAGVPVIGGMASGGQGPRQNILYLNDVAYTHGAVGLVLEGAVEICAAVSQGCRPVGAPFVVTSCRDNLILKLGGKPAAKVMFGLMEGIAPKERELFRRGTFLGIAIDPTRSEFRPADLLVRQIVGIQPQDDAIAVGESQLRVGQTIQFMVRDADSASDELEEILASHAPTWVPAGKRPGELGGLLFSCSGRGTGMFGKFHHDVGCMQGALGPSLPVAGFFANGEIGPVGGQSFLHGFSATIALLRQRT